MRWTVHSEKPLYEDEWLDIWVADVELPDGRHLEHRLIRMAAGAAASPAPRGAEPPSPATTRSSPLCRALTTLPDEILDGLHDYAGVIKVDTMVGVHGVHVHAARRKGGQFILQLAPYGPGGPLPPFGASGAEHGQREYPEVLRPSLMARRRPAQALA
jgi:hypothetical protein